MEVKKLGGLDVNGVLKENKLVCRLMIDFVVVILCVLSRLFFPVRAIS